MENYEHYKPCNTDLNPTKITLHSVFGRTIEVGYSPSLVLLCTIVDTSLINEYNDHSASKW